MGAITRFDKLLSKNSYISAIWKFDNPKFQNTGVKHFHVLAGNSEDGFLFFYITKQKDTITNYLDSLKRDYSSAVSISPANNNTLTYDSFIICYQIWTFTKDDICLINKNKRIELECGYINENEYEQICTGVINSSIPEKYSSLVQGFKYKEKINI